MHKIQGIRKDLQSLCGLTPIVNPGALIMWRGGGIGTMAQRSKVPLP